MFISINEWPSDYAQKAYNQNHLIEAIQAIKYIINSRLKIQDPHGSAGLRAGLPLYFDTIRRTAVRHCRRYRNCRQDPVGCSGVGFINNPPIKILI